MVKHAFVTMVKYYEHKQRHVVGNTIFQKYHSKSIADGIQFFLFCNWISLNAHGACDVFGECLTLKRLPQIALSVLR